jgi:hypothetical protein
MLRELVASLPAEQAAGAQRQLEAQADELKRAVQADSNAKAAEADFVYDYYMCEAGEAAELEAEARSRDAAATSAEQENVSWQQRLAHLPVLHVRTHARICRALVVGVWVVLRCRAVGCVWRTVTSAWWCCRRLRLRLDRRGNSSHDGGPIQKNGPGQVLVCSWVV